MRALPNACVGVGWLGFFLGFLQELAVWLVSKETILILAWQVLVVGNTSSVGDVYSR
jgi:hypothetical protein